MLKLPNCLISVLLFCLSLQSYAQDQVNFPQLYQQFLGAKTVTVSAYPMLGCDFSTQNPQQIRQVVNIVKQSHPHTVPANLWFFGATKPTDEERFLSGSDSSVTFELKNGASWQFKLGEFYINESTVDAALVGTRPDRKVMIAADWTIHRELFNWARNAGISPTVPLRKVVLTPFDIELGETYQSKLKDNLAKQNEDIRFCKTLIKRHSESNYYRENDQQICSGFGQFYQLHPETCPGGWEMPHKLKGDSP